MAVVSGGTTLIDNGALDAGVPTGALTLLETQTASASATIDFTSNIDSTYDAYMFKFYNIHPSVGTGEYFSMNLSSDGGSNYNVTKTTTYFRAIHDEADTNTVLEYRTDADLAQSTADHHLCAEIGADNDECGNGTLTIYNPSSTTFVKHFVSRFAVVGHTNDYARDFFTAGYGNTTSAIDSVRFQMASGNIDSGVIKLYGVK